MCLRQWRIQSRSQGGGGSKVRKFKWLVKVGATKGETPLIKKIMARGGVRATRTPPWIRHCNDVRRGLRIRVIRILRIDLYDTSVYLRVFRFA